MAQSDENACTWHARIRGAQLRRGGSSGERSGPATRVEIDQLDALRCISARGEIGPGEEHVAGNWRTDDVEQPMSVLPMNIDALAVNANHRMKGRTAEINKFGHDSRFLRNGEFYLGGCTSPFAVGRTDVVRSGLVKP